VFDRPSVFPGGASERGGSPETAVGPRGHAVAAEQRGEACGATLPQIKVKQRLQAWDRTLIQLTALSIHCKEDSDHLVCVGLGFLCVCERLEEGRSAYVSLWLVCVLFGRRKASKRV
jgi:hypothetical protein